MIVMHFNVKSIRHFVKQFIACLVITFGIYMIVGHFSEKNVIKNTTETTSLESINYSNRIYKEDENSIYSINLIGAKFDFLQNKLNNQTINILLPEHSQKQAFSSIGFKGKDMPTSLSVWHLGKQNKNTVSLHFKNETWDITQTFNFNKNILTRNISIKNISKQKEAFGIINSIEQNSQKEHEFFITDSDNIQRLPLSTSQHSKTNSQAMRKQYGGWIGLSNKDCVIASKGEHEDVNLFEDKGKAYVNVVYSDKELDPEQETVITTKTYLGFKEEEDLNALGMNKVLNYGRWGFVVRPLSKMLSGFHYYLGSAALALIAFTFAIKLISLPLLIRSHRTTKKMQSLQPAINALREQYRNSPQVLQLRTLELYRSNGLNPLSAFLQPLVQLLLFLPIVKLFNTYIGFKGAPFLGIVKDLSTKDYSSWTNLFGLAPWEKISYLPDFGLLPLIMALTFFLQPIDNSNKNMKYILLLVMLVFSSNMQSAIVIYWIITNLLTIVQTKFIK